MDKCNHDIRSLSHTVNLLPRKNMALPDMVHGICCVCRQSLIFIREQDSDEFVLKEVSDENATDNVQRVKFAFA